jgi:hypothetical protein
MQNMDNNLHQDVTTLVQKALGREAKGEIRFPELIQVAGEVLTDIREQSEGGQEAVTDALAILNAKIIERYGSLDTASFIKDLQGVGEKDLAEKLAKIYTDK